MRLFSEKVKPTLTNSPLNILQVENFEEIFFGVYEVEINKNKYPVEKISEHKGNPVVSVPVEVKGKKANYPFVLTKGKLDIIFNENSECDEIFEQESPPENIQDDIPVHIEEKQDQEIPELNEKKKEILEEIARIKKEALIAVDKKKSQKSKEIREERIAKEKALGQFLEKSRENLVDEFVIISNKIKDELISENDNRFSEIEETIDNKIQDLASSLNESLKKDFDNSTKLFDKSVKQLIKELYDKNINPKVDKELKNIAVEVSEKISEIDKNINQKIESKADISLVENVNKELDAIRDANIELNNNLNKGVQKALSRVGNVDKKIGTVIEKLDQKIEETENDIINYFDEKIKLVKEETLDITDEAREYFQNLIEESRDNFLAEIRTIKNEKPIEYVLENKTNEKVVKDWDSIEKEWNKKIHDKFEHYKTDLRKYIAVYASGGGTNAVQYANGGIINGELTVVDGINTPYVQFDTTISNPPTEGLLQWNSTDGTLDLGLIGGDVNLQIGQEILVRVKNDQGTQINNGQVVYISGAAGDNPLVKLADADNTTADAVIGVATENIASNDHGYITTFGRVRDLNTNLYSAGTVLYLSQTPGEFTNIIPSAPAHTVKIGTVLRQNTNNGIVLVDIDNKGHLGDLHDVKITSPQSGDSLIYNSISGIWVNKSVGSNSSVQYEWRYDTSAIMADPGSGKVRSNATNAVDVTEIAISRYDSTNIDTLFTLAGLSVGDLIFAQEKQNANNWSRFSVRSTPINNGSWFLIPVTFIENGGSPATKNTDVLATFVYDGRISNNICADNGYFKEAVYVESDCGVPNKKVATEIFSIAMAIALG